jgi:hypothetical protein
VSRQKPDAHEADNGGPLFGAPPVSHLSHTADPATSRQAAVNHIASGRMAGDALLLLSLIEDCPGETMAVYGVMARERTRCLDDFKWRLKLGRRTGTLKDAGLIHIAGERDGMSLWFPGPEVR